MKLPLSVRVRWVNKGKARLPQPPTYSTMARFAEDAGADEAWSIVLEFSDVSSDKEIQASAHFLSEDAPCDRLKSGVTFEMVEGFEVTAYVRVL